MYRFTGKSGLEKLEIKIELDWLHELVYKDYVLNEPKYEPFSGLKLE